MENEKCNWDMSKGKAGLKKWLGLESGPEINTFEFEGTVPKITPGTESWEPTNFKWKQAYEGAKEQWVNPVREEMQDAIRRVVTGIDYQTSVSLSIALSHLDLPEDEKTFVRITVTRADGRWGYPARYVLDLGEPSERVLLRIEQVQPSFSDAMPDGSTLLGPTFHVLP